VAEILRVFVASTSEFREERERLKQQIEELNVLWATKLGIVLQLVGWETHTYPRNWHRTSSRD